MKDNLIILSANAPRIHQAIIAKLIYGLTDLYLKSHSQLFPYPKTMIDESQTSPAPDVMLVHSETDLTKAIIEITHTQGVKKDAQKLQELMKVYDISEGFIYDYKYDLQKGQQKENTSWCDAVGVDLAKLLF